MGREVKEKEGKHYEVRVSKNGSILNKQEIISLILVINGWGNRDIANYLFLSESAVKKIFESIFKKLNVHNRAQAIAIVIFHKIITEEMCRELENQCNITMTDIFFNERKIKKENKGIYTKS